MGKKYFTISYDDGVQEDERIIELMQKYGIRGTFNLSSELFGKCHQIHRVIADIGVDAKEGRTKKCVDHNIMSLEKALQVYAPDCVEIAGHGAHHLRETELSPEEMEKEIVRDAKQLENLFGKPVRGHIAPYGAFDEKTNAVMQAAGLIYGRKAVMYQKPKDFYLHQENGIITPTCWHLDEFTIPLLEEFLAAPCEGRNLVFYMWGHGYELSYGTKRGNFEYLEKIFSLVSQAEDVICVTNGELMDALHLDPQADAGRQAIPIWGRTVPYNSCTFKERDMTLSHAPQGSVMLNWVRWVFGKKLMRDNLGHDDFVWHNIIKKGQAKETYEDIPTITPFVVPGSKTSVVIAPGGGFCMVSTDNEGIFPAKLLNENGISAFVLNYRLEPYRFPIPCLDLQRAIRWVRHHAAEYGVPADSVGAMGFSAGGYTIAGSAILLGNGPVEAAGYRPDEVDAENGVPDYLIPVYPVVDFDTNPNMLANLKGPEFYTDPVKREEWKKDYSLTLHVENAKDIPQFMTYGTKDPLGGQDAYAAKLLERPDRNQVFVIEGAGHGFSGQKKWKMWEKPCVDWIRLRK